MQARAGSLRHVEATPVPGGGLALAIDAPVTVQQQGQTVTLSTSGDMLPFRLPLSQDARLIGFFHGGVAIAFPGHAGLTVTQGAGRVVIRPGPIGDTAVPAPADSAARLLSAGALPTGWSARVDTPPTLSPNVAAPALAIPDDRLSARDGVPDVPSAQSASRRIFLPLGDKTGIAFFRSGDQYLLLADGEHAMDASAISPGSPFSGLDVSVRDGLTRLSFPAVGRDVPGVRPCPGGWILDADSGDGPSAPFEMTAENGGMLFSAPDPVRTLRIADPVTGRALLVGLVSGSAGYVGAGLGRVGYSVRPSRAGLVIEALSDRLELRMAKTGFFLDALGAPLMLAHGAQAGSAPAGTAGDVSPLLHLAALPALSVQEMRRRAWQEAAIAAPADRSTPRLRAARLSVALNDAPTARDITDTLIRDQPDAGADASVRFLKAATVVLAHRVDEQEDAMRTLDDPDLGNTPEALLWRGLAMGRQRERQTDAALLIDGGFPAFQAYPAPLRAALAPDIAEILGRSAPPDRAGARLADPALAPRDFGEALLASRTGHEGTALATFDRLAKGADLVAAAKARFESIALRRHLGRLDATGAGRAMDALVPDARLAGIEPEVRAAGADAWMAAGRWQDALSTLDGLDADERPRSGAWSDRLVTILNGLAALPDKPGPETPSAITVATLIEHHVSQVADPLAQARLRVALADRFARLDLWSRAADDLAVLWADPAASSLRPDVGVRFARAMLELGRPDQAVTITQALRDDPSAMGRPDLESAVSVLAARAAIAQGRDDDAIALLNGVSTDEALGLRADTLERRQNWAEAVRTLAALVAARVPADGSLDDAQQALVVRLAADASRAGDHARLDELARRYDARITNPRQSAVFRLLSAAMPSLPAGTRVAALPADKRPFD
ncbi:hypothetical protein AA103196_1307 [Ameyamaea chiangmaiensis NBRC 103196]|nr:hypothetical protein AA103196_1307 [Ameyamaea chiangmaiensis NBRC 103196]